MRNERPRRWPVHPQPAPAEALSSWLGRVAGLYGLSVRQLLDHNLGPASEAAATVHEDDIDWDPPQPMLEALVERTGADIAVLHRMTIAGWQPWLIDALDPDLGPEAFHTYVRQDSVLLRQGEAGTNVIGPWLPWLHAQHRQRRAARRICPTCAHDPDRGRPLTAEIPIMLSCPEHGCRLEDDRVVEFAILMGKPVPHRRASEHILTLDRLTHQGLITGAVTLPRRAVHVGVWLRLLRTLLDEVSISPSRAHKRSAAALEQIWDTSGHPPRAGISVWRPYETFDITRQEAILEAAAITLHLTRSGKITARGSLGPLLTIQPHRHVYDGDRPSAAELARRAKMEAMRQAWARAQQYIEAWFDTARTDPATARQIFGILTHYSRTPEAYDAERNFMIRQGIPAAFLPDSEPGRFAPSNSVR